MISYLSGTLISKGVDEIIIEVAGVGYGVGVSSNTLMDLPPTGEKIQIFTLLAVREDALTLYGFSSQEERRMFERLTSVSGIGPKVALSILSTLDVASLVTAVNTQNLDQLTAAPGVGKKTAQRLLLELSNAIENDPLLSALQSGQVDVSSGSFTETSGEAFTALLGMGFTQTEAHLALAGYDGKQGDTAAEIRYALGKLGSS